MFIASNNQNGMIDYRNKSINRVYRLKERKMELTEKNIKTPLTVPNHTSLIPLPTIYLQAATNDNTRTKLTNMI
jgi:hypothetical protein